jgi:argininosuccinate lyase
MIADMQVSVEAMAAAAGAGYATATDLADWLVREAGLPFRQAHHITGRAVAMAEERNCALDELDLAALRGLHEAIDERVYGVLTVKKSVASRTSFGGTAPQNVIEQIAYWRRQLAMEDNGRAV